VGIDYIQSKQIEGNTVEEVIDSCIKVMKADGLIKDMTYKRGPEGILLKLDVNGCLHMEKEIMLKKNGVQPYCCPITNASSDAVSGKPRKKLAKPCLIGKISNPGSPGFLPPGY